MKFAFILLCSLSAIFSLLLPVSSIGSEIRPPNILKLKSCSDVLISGTQHKPKVEIQALNKTDQALWKASGDGNQEIGVVELVSSDGKILAATDFVYQKQTGKVIQTNIHVPIKDVFFDFIQRIQGIPQASVVRFTHVHPKILTSSGVLHVGPNWIFSPGDKQASYVMKFLLEQTQLSHLSLEMHLVYQAPFTSGPKKKKYSIDSTLSWANGDYSLGKENDRNMKALLRGRDL